MVVSERVLGTFELLAGIANIVSFCFEDHGNQRKARLVKLKAL